MKTYEIFTAKYSQIIQADNLRAAIMKFIDKNPGDEIIGIHNVKYNDKLLSPSTPLKQLSDEEITRNWVEDIEHENGNYQCRCVKCDNLFFGHKRRVVCKRCFQSDHINPIELLESILEQGKSVHPEYLYEIIEERIKILKHGI